ncbi:5-oxoprolinase subunit PxpA [Mongoliitalea lutea]|uniref:UPF0271 protein n=1 Tax=Mongoliitalea lutea TaxID=849756 RepID=A0A8J3CWK5_9BACT|nr:5-oxoprolinase subunit PxpA [Mongoliitalea lutea]GHB29022.1 UPF0271 protein [Mongoliitalea lutea]
MMDINCDLGEGLPHDAALMPFLHSCNIACGGHAGDEKSIQETILLAAQHGVKIGAHPSYPDRLNFGRNVIDIPLEELKTSLREQIAFVATCAEACQVPMHHIKAHGALYNESAKNHELANLLIGLVQEHYPGITLYVPPHSLIASLAQKAGIPIMLEVFGDRHYESDYSLVARTHPQALIIDAQEAKDHIERLMQGKLKTIHGEILNLKGDTLCIHGDNPAALSILQLIQTYASNH